MRKQYHFQPSQNGFFAWDVDKLIENSKNLPAIKVNLEDIDAVKFKINPAPDFVVVQEDDLSY